MKTILGLFAILIVLIAGVAFLKYVPVNGKTFFSKDTTVSTGTAVINNHTLTVMVAKDDKSKEVGLSGRSSIPQDTGMVFPFGQPGYYAFWMHQMKFPLDIIFLRNNHIVTIYKNVPNPSFPTATLPIYKPEEPADTVLEVNAGLSSKYNLKKGDTVKLTL